MARRLRINRPKGAFQFPIESRNCLEECVLEIVKTVRQLIEDGDLI